MRVVSWFSCGAASAVATVLAAVQHEGVEAVYCRVVEEHPDNLRFLDDFSNCFGIPVKIIINEKYQGSAINTFKSRRYIKDQKGGAPCTFSLKKEMRRSYQLPNDVQVFGYTSEEQDRANRFLDANNDVNEWFPLLENNLTKQDCLYLVKSAGIELPMMYRLGYNNNNCIGCVKGGMGYWNKIRRDFPDRFNEMAKVERMIGFAINKDRKGMVFLDDLSPTKGHAMKDMPTDCGFTCEVSK